MNLSKSDQARVTELESKVKNFVNAFEQVFGGSATTNAASTQDQENKLLTAFRALDQAGRDKVLSYAEGLVKEGEESMKKENAYLSFESALQRAAASGNAVSFS